MPDKSIVMSLDSVRAILAGRKTQTRRIVKGVEPDWIFENLDDSAAVIRADKAGEMYPHPVDGLWAVFYAPGGELEFPMIKSRYQPGDVIYVKEAWCWQNAQYKKHCGYNYCEACIFDEGGTCWNHEKAWYFEGKKSPVFMPKAAARIWLRVTRVRVKRLQEITDADVWAEGVNGGCTECGNPEPCGCDNPSPDPVDAYAWLWDHINGKKKGCSWADNPFVFIYELERVKR